jgi:hypothetical protein
MIESMARKRSSRKVTATAVPIWALRILENYVDRFIRQGRLLRLSIEGISLLPGRAGLVKALHNLEAVKRNVPFNKNHPEIKRAEQDRKFAQLEVENGFPILYEQSTIAMWGLLESFVKHLLAEWIKNIASARNIDAIKNLSIKLGEYESLDDSERCLWIIDLLDQSRSGRLKSGVNRFETLLELFELDGAVEENTRKVLFELSKVRNVIVHKTGIIDRQFVSACPWYGAIVGQKVVLNEVKWLEYAVACDRYISTIIGRVTLYFKNINQENNTSDSSVSRIVLVKDSRKNSRDLARSRRAKA